MTCAGCFQRLEIGFNENETPHAPVRFCSLRNTGPEKEGGPPRLRDRKMTQGQSHFVDPRLALIEEENMREIGLVRDRVAERRRVIDEEHVIIEGAGRRGFGEDGWIWVLDSFADGYSSKFFLSGWRSPLERVIWSRESKCVLMLPYSAEPASPGRRLDLQLHLAIPKASASNAKTIGIRVDDGPIENFRVSKNDIILTVQTPTEFGKVSWRVSGRIPPGRCNLPRRDGRLHGSMVMGVRRFRYRFLSS